MLRAPRQLPGYRFEVQAPALDLSLPRLDVAAFVGFAARGPIHRPVVVEDVAHFEAIFGGDLPLAWDAEKREMTQAHLPLAVRAFFRNGGRRCWIVRVAEIDDENRKARVGIFPLTGIVSDVPGQANLIPANIFARSAGSWSDTLQVSCNLLVQAVRALAIELSEDRITLHLNNPPAISVGEMLRLTWGDSTLAIGSVSQIDPVAAQVDPAGLNIKVVLERVRWFSQTRPRPDSFTGDGMAYSLLPGQDKTPLKIKKQPDVTKTDCFVIDDYVPSVLPRAGSLIQIGTYLADGSLAPFWLRLTDVVDLRRKSGQVEVYGSGLTQLPTQPQRVAHTAILPQVEILRLAVLSRQHEGDPKYLLDMGLAPEHPRFLGALPDDQTYYDREARRPEAAILARLWDEAASFPLIGQANVVYYPVAVPAAGEVWLPRLEQDERSPLERDGLSNYNSQLFMDKALVDATSFNLTEQADQIHYLASQPRQLSGIHGLLDIDEISLIAAPDAVHRGWFEDTSAFSWANHAGVVSDTTPGFEVCSWETLERPEWVDPSPSASFNGTFALTWQIDSVGLSAEPITYILEESRRLDASDAVVIFQTTTRQQVVQLIRYGRSAGDYYYRVKARQGVLNSPYSLLCHVAVPTELFTVCRGLEIKRPEWAKKTQPDTSGTFELVWQLDASDLPSEPITYTVEEARRPDGQGAVVIYQTTSREQPERFTLFGRTPGIYYYRVRAQQGTLCSLYSLMLPVTVAPPSRWRIYPSSDPVARNATDERLLAVHQKLIQMCVARGDMFAVLTLPGHYREKEVLSYASRLQHFGQSEPSSLSYGALYHPWIVSRESSTLVTHPPDGAVLGIFSRRADRGAWIAPAAEVMQGVMGLSPALPLGIKQSFLDAQVNLLRQEPRGFMTLSADTLSPDSLLRPINVRRLLILLRRTALQRGYTNLFEPNDDSLRRLLEREYEGLLNLLFRKGAFAGQTPAESYQVVVRNGPQEIDRGQVIIELRVAPSLPLVFLIVRLVQSGARITVQENA